MSASDIGARPSGSMRPSPVRRKVASYPFACTLNTRLSDVDGQGHLNNSVIAFLYETARARMHLQHDHLRHLSSETRLVAANLSMSYIGEGFFPHDVEIGCGVTDIGRSSYAIGQGLFQRGACIGTADIVLVFCDRRGPSPLPAALRDNLETLRLPAQV